MAPAIPLRTQKEARQRYQGQLVQWDHKTKTGFVQLDAAFLDLDLDVAELWGHDLRRRSDLAEGHNGLGWAPVALVLRRNGQRLDFLIGIEPQAGGQPPVLRCGDVVPSRSDGRPLRPVRPRSRSRPRSPRRPRRPATPPPRRVGYETYEEEDAVEEKVNGKAKEKIEFEEDDADSQVEGPEPVDEVQGCRDFLPAVSSGWRTEEEPEEDDMDDLVRSREQRPRRVPVDWIPRTGRICDWNADATEGWIEADELLPLRGAKRMASRVWFSENDLSSPFDPFHPDFDIEKLACKFMLTETDGELSAAFVTLTDEGAAFRPQPLLPPLKVLAPLSPRSAGTEGSEKNAGLESEEHEAPASAPAFEETDEEVPGDEVPGDEEELEEPEDGADERSRSAQQSAKVFLQREVPEAVKVFEDAETIWSVSDLGKRVTKYFMGSLTAAADRADWRSTGKKFAEKGLRSFANACGSRKWFPDAEEVLKPVLARAAWELVQDCENVGEASLESMKQLVDQAYLEMMEYQNFEWAVGDAVRRAFRDQDQEVRTKVHTALTRTHQGAEKDSLQVEGNLLRQIEAFTESWLNKSMDRACLMMDSEPGRGEELLDEDTVVHLFRYLLHPEISKTYSCIPAALRKNGRPPRGWKFLRPCVQDMLKRWAEVTGEQCPRRLVRKRPMPAALRGRSR